MDIIDNEHEVLVATFQVTVNPQDANKQLTFLPKAYQQLATVDELASKLTTKTPNTGNAQMKSNTDNLLPNFDFSVFQVPQEDVSRRNDREMPLKSRKHQNFYLFPHISSNSLILKSFKLFYQSRAFHARCVVSFFHSVSLQHMRNIAEVQLSKCQDKKSRNCKTLIKHILK